MPVIVKIFPLEIPYHYEYLNIQPDFFEKIYIETPLYALFIKEAWMYCFAKNKLSNSHQHLRVYPIVIS